MSAAASALRLPASELDLEEEVFSLSPEPVPDVPRVFEGLSEQDRTFTDFQNYEGATFTGPVTLRNCKFAKGFSFKNARFLGPVTFVNVTVTVAKGNKSIFEGAQFDHTVSFSKFSSLYMASFEGCIARAKFEYKGRFYARAKFERSTFEKPAHFSGALFNGAANFMEASFKSTAEFSKATFRYRLSHARFVSATFEEFASFNDAGFAGHADFTEAQFLGGATFHGAEFSLPSTSSDENGEPSSNANDTQGDLRVVFKNATFQGDYLGQVVDFGQVRFGDQNFKRDVTFDGARFLRSKSAPTNISVGFSDIDCLGNISFRGAEFALDVDFSVSRFEGDLDLSDATFKDEANFEKVKVSGSVSLANTEFWRFPDFRQSIFTHQPQLYDCRLPKKLGRLRKLDRKTLLPKIGALRRIANKTDDKKTELNLLVQELRLNGGVASRLYGMLSNYGQSWLRPAMWLAAVTMFVFPVLILFASGLYPRDPAAALSSITQLSVSCQDQRGNALAAAVELSLSNALIVGNQSDALEREIWGCLSADTGPGLRSVLMAALQTLQALVTLVLAFFVGAAVKRRLQLR